MSLSFNIEFLKAKIKSHGDEVTDFYDRKIPTVDSNHTCLGVISLGSALMTIHSFPSSRVGTPLPFLREPPPSGYPLLSEANLKLPPSF